MGTKHAEAQTTVLARILFVAAIWRFGHRGAASPERGLPGAPWNDAWRLAMQHKPGDYRMMAAMCVEIANGMSLDTDRLRLTDRAQEWLDLAQRTEAAQLPEIADGGSVVGLESQAQTDAIELGKSSEDEQLPESAQISLASQAQADVKELVQKAEDGQSAEIFEDRPVGLMQSLELQTQTDAKSRPRTDFGAEDREMADDAGLATVLTGGTPRLQFSQSTSAGERAGHRSAARQAPGVGRAWSMLCSVLPLAVFALLLAALFAWGP
jgi:hypothetical protein